jgi:hypothetical protein
MESGLSGSHPLTGEARSERLRGGIRRRGGGCGRLSFRQAASLKVKASSSSVIIHVQARCRLQVPFVRRACPKNREHFSLVDRFPPPQGA